MSLLEGSTEVGGRSGRRLLTDRTFVQFWSAQTVSQLGDEVLIIALPLIVYATTGSASAMALVFGMTMLPHIVLGIFGGAIADRLDQRRFLALLSSIAAMILVALAALIHFGHASLAAFAIVAVALASVASALLPAYESCVPRLATSQNLVPANSYLEMSRIACAVAGPALAGLLVGAGDGTRAVIFNAGCFVVAASLLLFLPALAPRPVTKSPTARSLLADVREGLRLAVQMRSIRFGITLSTTTNICASALVILAIFQLRDKFHVSPAVVGGFLTGSAIFALVVAPLMPYLNRWLGYTGGLVLGMAMSAAACVTMALAASPAWVAVVLALETAGATLFNITWRAMRQHIVGPTSIGRISGVCRGLAFSGAAVGGWFGGIAVQLGGLASYLVTGAALVTALCVFTLVRLPARLLEDMK